MPIVLTIFSVRHAFLLCWHVIHVILYVMGDAMVECSVNIRYLFCQASKAIDIEQNVQIIPCI